MRFYNFIFLGMLVMFFIFHDDFLILVPGNHAIHVTTPSSSSQTYSGMHDLYKLSSPIRASYSIMVCTIWPSCIVWPVFLWYPHLLLGSTCVGCGIHNNSKLNAYIILVSDWCFTRYIYHTY